MARWKVAFLGRWGSDAIEAYLEEAYAEMGGSFAAEALDQRDTSTPALKDLRDVVRRQGR